MTTTTIHDKFVQNKFVQNKIVQNKIVQGKLVRRMLVGVAVALATLGATAVEPAAAWQFGASSGSLGNVTLPTIYAGDVYQAGSKYFTLYGSTGPVVYRSPASTGTQQVRVKYVVERWNGAAWAALASSPIMYAQIYAGQSGVRFANAPWLLPSVTTGYFRVTFQVGWLNSAGTTLGLTSVVSSLAGEHVCGTVNPNRGCQNYAGFVYVG